MPLVTPPAPLELRLDFPGRTWVTAFARALITEGGDRDSYEVSLEVKRLLRSERLSDALTAGILFRESSLPPSPVKMDRLTSMSDRFFGFYVAYSFLGAWQF